MSLDVCNELGAYIPERQSDAVVGTSLSAERRVDGGDRARAVVDFIEWLKADATAGLSTLVDITPVAGPSATGASTWSGIS